MKKVFFVLLFVFTCFTSYSNRPVNIIAAPDFPSKLGYDCIGNDMYVCVSCAGGLFNYSKLGGPKICD